MSTETALSRWLRSEMPRRGYPLGGPRAGGISALAKASGLPQPTVSRLVNGQAGEPDVKTLRKLGEVFGYTLSEMMVFAELAEPGEMTLVADPNAESAGAQPGLTPRLREVPEDPADFTQEAFLAMIKAGVEPPYPPGGILNPEERIIWALDVSAQMRWAGIKGMRNAAASVDTIATAAGSHSDTSNGHTRQDRRAR